MINIGSHVRYYDKKYICSGSVIECVSYLKGVYEGFDSKAKGKRADSEGKRADNLNKSKANLRRLINANATGNDLFITLTYAENMINIDKGKDDFKKFAKRLNYRLVKQGRDKIKYVYVVEFQKRGAVHFHCMFFNCGYLDPKILSEIWGHGFVKINRINDVDNAGAYVVKYMNKDMIDERLVNKDLYGRSRGLNEPIEIKDPQEVAVLEGTLKDTNLVYQSMHPSEYYGAIQYKQYNLRRKKSK